MSDKTINTPNGPAREPTPTVGVTAELILTAPDEGRLQALTLVAMAITDGRADLYRSTASPWQLRVTQGAETDDAVWRDALKRLIEVY